jgi:O-antigen/teichoic acid export membrane protein
MSGAGVSRISRVLRNASFNYLGAAASVGVMLLVTPIVVGHLGVAVYAIWVLAHRIVFYINFVDLGLYSAVVKYVAQLSGRGDTREMNRVIGATPTALSICGVVVFPLSRLIAGIVGPGFFDPAKTGWRLRGEATWVLGLSGLSCRAFGVDGAERREILKWATDRGSP